ncbi:MAG: hypothetical protein IPK83_21305 [Planctomycetes bacterium]|nr:hypothetical protein [Planctomycetota bacterium]
MAEYQEQQVSEATGGKLAFAWYHAPTVLRWLAVAVVLAGAPIYLAYRPEDYTPLVETLLNVFLFLLAYWIGCKQESA